MNYKKVYYQLIDKRLKEKLTEYDLGEDHHIKPVSFFPEGTPQKVIDKDNKVRLNFREHFVAHCLLAKIYEYGTSEWVKMHHTMKAMKMIPKGSEGRYINSRLFEHFKIEYRCYLSEEAERKGVIRINELCDWMDENGKKPVRRKGDSYQTTLASKISTLKLSKFKDYGFFFDSFQTLVENRGYPELFEYDRVDFNSRVDDVVSFIKSNNKKPSTHSKDSFEKSLSSFIGSTKAKIRDNKIPKEELDYITETDTYEIFKWVEDKTKSFECRIDELKEFVETHKRTPSYDSVDDFEKLLRGFIFTTRRKIIDNELYSNHYQYMKDSGLFYIFDISNKRFETFENRIQNLKEFIEMYDKIPSQTGELENEYSLSRFICRTRSKKRKDDLSIDDLEIISKYKLDYVFEIINNIDIFEQRLIDVANFIKIHNKKPRPLSKDTDEKILGNFITTTHTSINKGITKERTKLIKKYGLCYLFDRSVSKFEKHLNNLKQFVDEFDRKPKKKTEKNLYNFVHHNKDYLRKGTLSEERAKLLKDANISHCFDSNLIDECLNKTKRKKI